MRTPGERTSGAWTGGCAIHPDGGDETDRTAGNSYTATPTQYSGSKQRTGSSSTLWRTCHRLPGPAKPREQYKQLWKSTTKLKNL